LNCMVDGRGAYIPTLCGDPSRCLLSFLKETGYLRCPGILCSFSPPDTIPKRSDAPGYHLPFEEEVAVRMHWLPCTTYVPAYYTGCPSKPVASAFKPSLFPSLFLSHLGSFASLPLNTSPEFHPSTANNDIIYSPEEGARQNEIVLERWHLKLAVLSQCLPTEISPEAC